MFLCNTQGNSEKEEYYFNRNYCDTMDCFMEISAAGERHLPPIDIFDET